MSKIINLFDRSRTAADWKCQRQRYWNYEYKGRGLSPKGLSLELFMGLVVHDAMAAIATFTKEGQAVPIEDIATLSHKQIKDQLLEAVKENPSHDELEFAMEQATLVEGLIRGFYKHSWPKLMALYPTIVCIEQEMEYTLGSIPRSDDNGQPSEMPFIFMAKPDLIVENNEGDLVYIEYKTTSSKKDKWIDSWNTAIQLHSSVMATEQTLGIRPAYVQILGLYKGWESYGKQSSPFCYAYKRNGNPPFSKNEVSYEYKAGFKRYPTWELEGGLTKWIEEMPDNVLADQFPQTPPIMVDEDLVMAFFRQRFEREKDIFDAMGSMSSENELSTMDEFFPQTFDACVPSFGYGCPFTKLCFSHVEDPLKSGFEFRLPHHARELEMIKETEHHG